MMRDKISASHLEMIDAWRRSYAFSNNSYDHASDIAPSYEVLREWSAKKGEYLGKLFGDELILSKPIKYFKGIDELSTEIYHMTESYAQYGREGRNGYKFYCSWYDDFVQKYFNHYDWEKKGRLNRLMDYDVLASNIYDGDSFEIEDRDGKTIKINHGCKVSKILGKLAKAFDLKGWEDFRICHSLILNQKALEGNLCISIHPMDYMTMSDNNCGWESCMSWTEEGGYRQGTVEMMNSRCVVVAYLTSNEELITSYEPRRTWNSKKWRQLFIVDRNVIASVKGYPYRNDFLTKEVMEWLRELAIERLGWNYESIFSFEYDKKFEKYYLPEEKNNFHLHFKNGNMYNDFGSITHFACFSTNINPDVIESVCSNHWMEIDYSGASQCMICGVIHPSLEDESCLACCSCQGRTRCDCCGEIVGETYDIDGYSLCSFCYENRIHQCEICEEEHLDDNMIELHIIPRITTEKIDELRSYFTTNVKWWSCSFANTYEDLKDVEFNYFSTHPDVWLCEDCQEDWARKNLKEGERLHLRKFRWNEYTCVYFDQLTEEKQLEILGWWLDNYGELSNEIYIKACFSNSAIEPTEFIKEL